MRLQGYLEGSACPRTLMRNYRPRRNHRKRDRLLTFSTLFSGSLVLGNSFADHGAPCLEIQMAPRLSQ